MFAVNQDKADESPSRTLRDLRGALLVQLDVIDSRFGVCRIFRWLWDEAQHSALMRELNLLNDHCLDDLGVRRPFDQRTDDLVKRLRAGG
jgi:uncharacterized protein YjiS (DUF1127 family)